MKSLKYLMVSVIVGIGLMLGFQPTSHALTLTLDDLSVAGVELILADNAAGDLNPNPGIIVWTGVIGVWNLNVETAFTYPHQGTPAIPYMHVNSVNTSSNAAGGGNQLNIMSSEINYTGLQTFVLGHGGTTGGTIGFDYWLDPANALFGQVINIGSFGPYGPGAFSGAGFGVPAPSAPYSLTLEALITHGSGVVSSSYDQEITVPEPTTLLLLGFALLGAGLVRRFRKN
jgi:hypothetical protein